MEILLMILLFAAAWFIIRYVRKRNRRFAKIVFSEISVSNFKIKGRLKLMELKEGQRATLLVEPKTRNGHPAAIQAGSGRWSSTAPDVISVEQDPTNELGAIIHGLDGSVNESALIEFRADGDPGEGVKEIVGTLPVTCTQGDAAVFDIGVHSVEDDEAPEQPGPAEPAEGEGGASGEGSGGATSEGSGEPAGGDPAEVQPGDPGTATGPPIDSGAPKGEDEPGEIGGTPVEDVPGASGDPIAGADTAGQPNPVEGTEADSTKPPA